MNVLAAMQGFDGRLNRQPFWLVLIILMIVAMVITFVVGYAMTGPRFIQQYSQGEAQFEGAVAELIGGFVVLYPWLAISVKRLHDRGRTGWWCVPFIALQFIVNILELLGLSIRYSSNLAGWAFSLVTLALGVVYLIDLGILKGTPGPNQYGPDPLAPSGTSTATV